MLIRFDCPACGGSHSFDMPETTIHMTCSRTHKVIQLRLTKGGDVKSSIVNGSGPSIVKDEVEKKFKALLDKLYEGALAD